MTSLPKPTDRLALGTSGLTVSPFCLGRAGSAETIPAAFDAGINFFFLTADMHWPRYETSRRGLEDLLARGGGIRDEIVVGTVSYATQPEFCSAPHQEVVASVVGLDRIDVAIAGGAYPGEFLTRLEVYERHRRERFEGTRAIGTTFHDRAAARRAVDGRLVDIAFLRFNVLHPGAREDVFERLGERTSTLLYNFKSTQGCLGPESFARLGLGPESWRPDVTDHYRFILTHPRIDGLLCSLHGEGQVEALARAMDRGPLTPEEVQYMIGLGHLVAGRATLGDP